MKQKFKLLGSALFDVNNQPSAHSCATVSLFHDLENETMNAVVRQGMLNLPSNPIPISRIVNIKSLEQYLKFLLTEVLPTYDGNGEIFDFYMSDHYKEQKAKYT